MSSWRARCSARAGLDESDLECGSHWPADHEATVALARSGRGPSDLHNNCSGKHSGFLCTCRHLGIATRRLHRARPSPSRNSSAPRWRRSPAPPMAPATGRSTAARSRPMRFRLHNLAHGFAQDGDGSGPCRPSRARAARRLLAACMAEPFFVAGTGRADTRLMSFAPGRIFVKAGAEGVYCAAVPELGLGVALKCDDGAGRGRRSHACGHPGKAARG